MNETLHIYKLFKKYKIKYFWREIMKDMKEVIKDTKKYLANKRKRG